MTRTTEKAIHNNLRAIIDATTDLLLEVGVPETPELLEHAERVRQLAFCECVRRVGEAVAQIDAIDDAWLGERFPDIPWRAVKSTRNRLTHHYWTVDYHILHAIATVHLPLVTGPVAAHLGIDDPYRPQA